MMLDKKSTVFSMMKVQRENTPKKMEFGLHTILNNRFFSDHMQSQE